MEATVKSPILVTGASGYIASHLIKLLLERGYRVRGTVRSLANKTKNNFIYNLVPEKNDHLELVEANLTSKEDWKKAVEGCEYIFHVASPIPPSMPQDENELIIPAVEGTLNVLEAAIEKGTKKVVVTSSGTAIMFGGADRPIKNEDDWSDESKCPPYPKSKVKAERAAWKFYEDHKDKIEVTVVNPGLVMGPVFTKHGNSSESLFSDILTGVLPGVLEEAKWGPVDVRDVAEAHYRAMFYEGTNGKRYICVPGESTTMIDMLQTLKKELAQDGGKINDKITTPEEIMASESQAGKRMVLMSKNRGPISKMSNERSLQELKMVYTPIKQTAIDMAHSLIKIGGLPPQ